MAVASASCNVLIASSNSDYFSGRIQVQLIVHFDYVVVEVGIAGLGYKSS